MEDNIQYVSAQSLKKLQEEQEELKNTTIPNIAKLIDEAKQQGDLSENAEYHAAREDMAWAQGRLAELENIINNSRVINHKNNGTISVGSTVTLKNGDKTKEYKIVGPQEVNPGKGLISNESPIGSGLIGHQIGDKVEITTPGGKQVYEIVSVE